MILNGKRYDRYVDDFINSHRYINCNSAICRNCHEMNIHIVKGLLNECAHLIQPLFEASDFSFEKCMELQRKYDRSEPLPPYSWHGARGAFVYGICNVVGASIPRNTDSGTYIHVGPEIGVASTKAFTGQVTVLMLLALCVGQMRGTVDDATVERIVRELKNMPLYIKDVLGLADKIKNLSKIYTYARNFLYLGRGYNYPTALEGALKLKEISYIHAEGYPAAEMKHGPIALVDSEMPTVVIAPTDSLYDKIISNVRQVKARGGTVVAIITKGNDAMKDIADHCLEVPDVPECLTPLVVSVPLQLLAYYIAINKDRNVDQPRNLAKSVTVE